MCIHLIFYVCTVAQAYMEDGWRDPLANYIRVCILTQARPARLLPARPRGHSRLRALPGRLPLTLV